MPARWLCTALMVTALLPLGCSGDDSGADDYPRQGSPRDALLTLQHAWELGDEALVQAVLAEDFVFHLDRTAEVPTLGTVNQWGTGTEVLASETLFLWPRLRDIQLELDYGRAHAVNELGREDWQVIDVGGVWIEVDEDPPAGEDLYTYAVSGHQQRFYFRQGVSAADHGSGSATSRRWYIVDWVDEGAPKAAAAPPAPMARHIAAQRAAGAPVPVYEFTWTDLKLLHLGPGPDAATGYGAR